MAIIGKRLAGILRKLHAIKGAIEMGQDITTEIDGVVSELTELGFVNGAIVGREFEKALPEIFSDIVDEQNEQELGEINQYHKRELKSHSKQIQKIFAKAIRKSKNPAWEDHWKKMSPEQRERIFNQILREFGEIEKTLRQGVYHKIFEYEEELAENIGNRLIMLADMAIALKNYKHRAILNQFEAKSLVDFLIKEIKKLQTRESNNQKHDAIKHAKRHPEKYLP